MANEQMYKLRKLIAEALESMYVHPMTGDMECNANEMHEILLEMRDVAGFADSYEQVITLQRLLDQTAKELKACKDTMRSLNAPPSDAYDSGLGHA